MTTPVCPGLEVSLTVTPDLSPGERKAEGVLRAKGQIISWSVTAKVKPAQEVCSDPTFERMAVCSVPRDKLEGAGEAGGEGVATTNKIKTQNHPFSGGPAKHGGDEAMSAKSNEDRMFKRGEEDYEHLLIDLKAICLGIKILPKEKDQNMFDPGEESKAHGDLDLILRGEEEVSRRVPNTKDMDWDDSTWCGMEWDEAEMLFPAPILWEQVGQGTKNVNPCHGTVLGRAAGSREFSWPQPACFLTEPDVRSPRQSPVAVDTSSCPG